jgi:hypothetical protein
MHHQGETEIDEPREQRRRVGHERHGEQEGEADPQARLRSLRAKSPSCVCWPSQKMPRVKKLMK